MVKTRFAPSPTGYLHIGGARTALYAWLYARAHQGHFVLRIEDTDTERSEQVYVDAIIEGMQWLGLDYDEGPFYQTQRLDRYRVLIEQLLSQGHAYKCYCSKERIDKLREQQRNSKQKPRYDGHCRTLKVPPDRELPYVIRFRNPTDGVVTFNDSVRGPISIANSELDDLIIARTDGSPTYNFCVVVDDSDMEITHVIRGDDHINNTPRQINLLKALGATLPHYAHLPMILGPDGKRLSKRHGAMSVLQYRDDGYLPGALLNYLVRLGWSRKDQEIFSKDEMIRYFDLSGLNNSPAAFNVEKFIWLNQHYLQQELPSQLASTLEYHLARLGVVPPFDPPLEPLIQAQQTRAKTVLEMAQKSIFFYQDRLSYDEKALAKHIKEPSVAILKETVNALEELPTWEKESIHQVIKSMAETFEVGMGKVAQPIRIAVSGGTVSPPIDETLVLLGQKKTIERIKRLLDHLNQL